MLHNMIIILIEQVLLINISSDFHIFCKPNILSSLVLHVLKLMCYFQSEESYQKSEFVIRMKSYYSNRANFLC